MFGRHGGILLLARLAAMLLAVVPCAASAQVDLLGQDQGPAAAAAMGEVAVTIESVGLNNAARPGEWVGIRLQLVDHGERQREILVRIVIGDADGDDSHPEVVATTNPGIQQPVWAYARLPFDIADLGGFAVQVFAAVEPDDPAAVPGVGFLPGRLLGQTWYQWKQNTGAGTGLMAVVGLMPAGLSGYQQGTGAESNPLGHEWTQVLPLRPDSLPDRWYGLSMVRELVWNGLSPSELRIEQVRALREWVERGGHLVVILPPVGQDWLAVSNQELAEMLPVVSVSRMESVPLPTLRPLLTDATLEELELPDELVTVHTFEPMAQAEPGQADPILNDGEGRCVVVSRTVGVGTVTMVGLPAGHPTMLRRGVPETDVFWHRVLGRRGHVATQAEFDKIQASGEFVPRNRPTLAFDVDIPQLIAKSGRSLAGVMLGLIVFIIYWIVAGPGGYALLKQKNLVRHAWLAFLGASLAFTALAWSGATLLRPKRAEISHLSFLDHVYGQRVQRVRSWASVLVPVYGSATVSLESDDAGAGGSRFVQAVAPWEPIRLSGMGGRGSFPDARAYQIDSRAPESLTFPARATIKQVQLDWAGGLAWESIRPVVEEGGDPFTAVRFADARGQRALDGELIHGLPGTLQDVKVILFRGQVPLPQTVQPRSLLASASAWAPGPWEPGVPLDLAAVTGTGTALLESRLQALVQTGWGDGLPSPGSARERFEWLALFNLFTPPDYMDRRNAFEGPPLARRSATHALDLSRWSTRPCLMVIGVLETEGEDSMAVPVRVETNGSPRRPHCAGLTIVRWVYPLPPSPPEVRVGEEFPSPDEGQ